MCQIYICAGGMASREYLYLLFIVLGTVARSAGASPALPTLTIHTVNTVFESAIACKYASIKDPATLLCYSAPPAPTPTSKLTTDIWHLDSVKSNEHVNLRAASQMTKEREERGGVHAHLGHPRPWLCRGTGAGR